MPVSRFSVSRLAASLGLAAAACAFAILPPASAHEEHEGAMPAMAMTPAAELPAGGYVLDLSHASIIFRVDHLGLTNYTARFTDFSAALDLDPSAPAGASLSVTVDAASLETDYPFEEPDFDAVLTGEGWLEAGTYPEITFVSTDVEVTGDDTAKVTGDFTLHGVTKPVTLDVTFNGGYGAVPGDPAALTRVGFSATTAINRSDFGIAFAIPAEGSKLGVSDEVAIVIEAEFYLPKDEAPSAE